MVTLRLSAEQEWLLDIAVQCGADGIGLFGSDWVIARALERKGFGTVTGTPLSKHRIGADNGRFIVHDDAGARLEAFRQAAVPESAHDPLYYQRALDAAACFIGTSTQALLERGPRPRNLVRGRWAVMFALAKREMSCLQIAGRVNRERTSVEHGIHRARELIVRDPDFAAMVEKVDAA